MAKMPLNLLDMVNNPQTLKVLGTADKMATVNVVPIGSFAALDEENLICGDLFMGKTKRNLEATKKATVTVFKSPTEVYEIKGVFQQWVRSGPIYETMQKMIYEQLPVMLRGLAMIRVEEVYSVSPLGEVSKLE